MTYVSIIPSVLIGSNYNSVRKNRPFSLIYQYGLNEYFIAQIILDLVTGSCVLVTYTPTVFILFLLSVTTRYSCIFPPPLRNQPFLQGTLFPFFVGIVFRKDKILALDILSATGISLLLGPFSRQI